MKNIYAFVGLLILLAGVFVLWAVVGAGFALGWRLVS